MKNTVYTIEEYMHQGFDAIEAMLVQEHDMLFNRWEELTEEEKERFWLIQDICKL